MRKDIHIGTLKIGDTSVEAEGLKGIDDAKTECDLDDVHDWDLKIINEGQDSEYIVQHISQLILVRQKTCETSVKRQKMYFLTIHGTRYTNDVIATAAFGISVNSMRDKDNDFYVNGKDATSFQGFWKTIKFIMFRICPSILRLTGDSFISGDTTFFRTLIQDAVKARDEKGIVRPDMIHLLMQARDSERITLSTDDIVAQAFVFFLAGFETVSTLMCYMLHELVLNPDIQQKLREEVDQVTSGADGEVTYEMLQKMKYMDMVISETLRKHPPVPVTDRVCVKSFKLPQSMPGYNDVTLDKDSIVWIPIHAFHHDPQYFPDPYKFDPERFNDENKDKIVPYTYFPFGLGPRICIGNRFALMETKMIMTHLVQNFLFKRTEKTLDSTKFTLKSLTVLPEEGFWLQLEPRKI
ncbi:cytochrome P450 9e2-like [Cephus cinctus]|uniref:Cytochrome P450 9e2-like n=1 Tax=Cephus cinctus TaxID=211228 RepID=A0AAJ7FM33_CEPCN|nr:cytochrome P450 9e2-like [Cephus cinctus]